MGGRGSSSGGGGGARGVNPANIVSVEAMTSKRENNAPEVDAALSVLRDVHNDYGVDVNDLQVATLKGRDAVDTMGYFDWGGNVAINKNLFDNAKMDSSYDDCVKSGYHPQRGKKSGMAAVIAHEMGHKLTAEAGVKSGRGSWALEDTAKAIVHEAAKRMGTRRVVDMRGKISGYARSNNSEAVAEAFADVYCNGSRARKISKTIVDILKSYYS